MSAYYPVFLDLDGRACLVVGGGSVAERKIDGLLRAGARVTVVCPDLTGGLARRAARGEIRHERRGFAADDLDGVDLAFTACDEPDVNEAVFREGRRRRVWVNAADDPERCDFIMPAIVRRGDLVVAISTGGSSPVLARAVREDLEQHLPEHYADLVALAAGVRRELRALGVAPSPEAWHRALGPEVPAADPSLRSLVAAGRAGAARDLLLARLRVAQLPSAVESVG